MKPIERPDRPDFEQFLKVLRREGGRDYVPFFELYVDGGVFEPMTGRTPPEPFDLNPNSPAYEPSFRYVLECFAQMGYDHGTINLAGFAGFPASTHQSGGGRSFHQADDCAIRSEADLDAYAWPDPDALDAGTMTRTARLAPDGMGVLTGGPEPFETLMQILGFTGLSMMMYDDPDLLGRIAGRIGETILRLVENATSLDCIQGYLISGDMGYKTGTMVSPEVLREHIFPWHRRIVEAAHANGTPILLHSCGNLVSVMDDIVEAGFDGKHSFEDAIDPGLYELHRRFGDRIALIGGVDVDFLCRADEAAVRARVREHIDTLAPGGGYLIGSGNCIADYMPVENYRAILDEGLRYGR